MEELIVTSYSSGTDSVPALREKLAAAWGAALSNRQEAEEIAKLLHVAIDKLKAQSSPVGIKTDQSGITGVEGAVLVIVGNWLLDVLADGAKEAAKEAIKEAAKTVWKKYIYPKLPHEALGLEHKAPHHRRK